MNKDQEKNLIDAKKFLLKHIKLLETTLAKLSDNDIKTQTSAALLAWCIHNFMKDDVLNKMHSAVEEITKKQSH